LLGKQCGEVIDPDKTPLGEYLTGWLDGRVDELTPLSVTQYRSVVKIHVTPADLVVAARLGHSSPMVSLSVYAHVLPTGDERAAEVTAGVLG
jgi:hypothetical protein